MIEQTLRFLDDYRDAIDLSIVDFYKLDAWSKIIPEAWKAEEMTGLTLQDLIKLPSTIFGAKPVKNVFLQKIQMYSMPKRFSYKQQGSSSIRVRNEKKCDKKRHEVDELSARIGELCRSSGVGTVFDFGAGQGYLSQTLAMKPWDFQVVALERDDGQCHGSLQRSSSIPNVIIRQLNITRDTKACELLDEFSTMKCCFCSLHACGSLTCNMLRMFVGCPEAVSMVNVACCYNLIDEDDFPMSSRLHEQLKCYEGLRSVLMGRRAKMLACQAAWRWIKEPVKTESSFKSNHYRAMLEIVLDRLGLNGLRLGGFPASSLKSFDVYCRIAFERLGHSYNEEIINEVKMAFDTKDNFKRLSLIWTMRALLAAVIEALILQDRVFYLEQSLPEGSQIDCVPMFDPVQSPRNLAIIALKSQ